MRALVGYATRHGSTRGVAEAIADGLVARGVEVEVQRLAEQPDPDGYDAVVVGSAIYYGSWMDEAAAYVDRFEQTLDERRVWLFSVGPLGTHVDDEEEQPRELTRLWTAVEPEDHHLFYGALDRSKLGFAERMVLKAVRAPEGDFRDWDDIRAWSESIADALVPTGP